MTDTCKRGHALTAENVAIRTTRGRPWRLCRECARETDRRYHASAKGREALARFARKQTPEQRKAHRAVDDRVRRGVIVREPCAACGEAERTEAHHPNGYEGEAALDIVWLCRRHHVEAHGRVLA